MNADELQTARQFLATLGTVAMTGKRESLFLWLAPDIEWVTPSRELVGIDQMREDFTWVSAPGDFDLEFQIKELTALEGDRVAAEIRELYRLKTTGAIAHARDRRIELAIRDGKVARYEMRVIGDEGPRSHLLRQLS